jgi:hypothetical protein
MYKSFIYLIIIYVPIYLFKGFFYYLLLETYIWIVNRLMIKSNIVKIFVYLIITCFLPYIKDLLIKWVTKVKLDISLIKVHP